MKVKENSRNLTISSAKTLKLIAMCSSKLIIVTAMYPVAIVGWWFYPYLRNLRFGEKHASKLIIVIAVYPVVIVG